MNFFALSKRSVFLIPAISSGKATFSITVRHGKVDSSWNTIPIAGCGPRTVSPATVTAPWYPSRRPPMTLNKVDLPQPEGPITARNSPGRTLNETRSTATSGPSGVSNCLTMLSTTRIPASAGVRALMAPEVGSVDTLAIKHSITRRAGKTKRAHHHESPRGHASLCPPYMLIGADLTPKQCSELLPSPLWGGVGGHERRHSIATTSQPPAPTLPHKPDLCTLLPKGVTMPDTVESGEAAPHGKGAGRAFGGAVAFPAGEARDDPGGPGEGLGGMGIFLAGGPSFILELEGGEEFDLAGFEQFAGGLGHLAVAGADQPHDAARRQGGDDGELHQGVGGFQLAGFDVEALAFHHPEQLLDVPAQAIPSDDPQGRLDIFDLVRRPQPPVDRLLAGRRIVFADVDHAQGHLWRRCARAQMGRARDRHLSKAQFELGGPRLALAGLGFQRQPEAMNHRHRRH